MPVSVLAPVPVPEAEPVVVPVDAVISVLVALVDAVLMTVSVFVATCEVPPPLPPHAEQDASTRTANMG
jgi:hypothetical protein